MRIALFITTVVIGFMDGAASQDRQVLDVLIHRELQSRDALAAFDGIAFYPPNLRTAVLFASTRAERILELAAFVAVEPALSGAPTRDDIIGDLEPPLQAAFDDLLAHADVLRTLHENIVTTMLLGRVIGRQPQPAVAAMERYAESWVEVLEVSRASWLERLAANAIAVGQLEEATREYLDLTPTGFTGFTIDPGAEPPTFSLRTLPSSELVDYITERSDRYDELASVLIDQWGAVLNRPDFDLAIGRWVRSLAATYSRSFLIDDGQRPRRLREAVTFERAYAATLRDAEQGGYAPPSRDDFLARRTGELPSLPTYLAKRQAEILQAEKQRKRAESRRAANQKRAAARKAAKAERQAAKAERQAAQKKKNKASEKDDSADGKKPNSKESGAKDKGEKSNKSKPTEEKKGAASKKPGDRSKSSTKKPGSDKKPKAEKADQGKAAKAKGANATSTKKGVAKNDKAGEAEKADRKPVDAAKKKIMSDPLRAMLFKASKKPRKIGQSKWEFQSVECTDDDKIELGLRVHRTVWGAVRYGAMRSLD